MAQNSPEPTAASWTDIVQQRAGALRFGSVQIIVHEGRVTCVETTEKTRLTDDLPAAPPSRR